VGVATGDDHDELFELYASIVEEGGAFPTEPPATASDFERAWVGGKDREVTIARAGGRLVGSCYVMPNYGGRAAHIANAGYMVHPDFRRRGLGEALVNHSLERARRLGFDAIMFNLVFESNPARSLYERLGFGVIGRVPEAVGDETALLYWRRL
jgi:ribosomal protein S18 acetylase RimI-like enzyme